jgi:hypothetical protein
MSGLWIPGAAGPLEELVSRIERRIERFAADAGIEQAYVEVELADGSRFAVEELSAEPGFGFVTVRPYPRDEPPAELIVPIGAIRRIELSRAAEQDAALGFSVRSD